MPSFIDEITTITQVKTVNDYFSILKFIAAFMDQHVVLEHPETELLVPETRKRIITFSPTLLLLEDLRASASPYMI